MVRGRWVAAAGVLVTLIGTGQAIVAPTRASAAAVVNLAEGRLATADSSEAGRPASLGADGSASTRWCAADGATGHWWQVDLGASAELAGTRIGWEFARSYQYVIDVSDDAVGWRTVVDQRSTTSTAQTRSDPFSARARYVRLTVTGLAAGTWASFTEFEVLGTLSAGPVPVSIDIDAGASLGELKPIYRFFGADEPNYAYMPDGERLLGDIGALGAPQEFFRTHSLMVTGDGTPALKWGSTNMYTEDADGNPVYDFTIVDRIFDTYLSKGVRPYVQIGFMPEALSTRPQPYQHDWQPGDPYSDIETGWAYPPKDYDKWRELVYQWARHSVERYGLAEVQTWYWQVWNEANFGYWKGTAAEFRKLHDYAIDGLRRAVPRARVGGADTAGPGGQFQRDFLTHTLRGTNYATGEVGGPLDFVSFHAKGAPSVSGGHVRMGIANQLRNVRDGFQIVASYPEYRRTPIVIGESDPDGCAACSAAVYPANAYRNTSLYASYTAASFARKHQLADRFGVNLEGALTWSFEFEDQPMFAGFRVMSTEGGINVPAFNTFRMFGRMGGQRLPVTSSHEVPLDAVLSTGVRGAQPDVSAMASVREGRLAVLAWNYHDDDTPGRDAATGFTLRNLPAAAAGGMRVTQYRIDAAHSNSYTAWQRMGSPAAPTEEQLAQLRDAGELQATGPSRPVTVVDGVATVADLLPHQSVSLLEFTY